MEYLFEVQKGRRTGDEFENHQAFIRYLGKHYLVKAEYMKNEILDLKVQPQSIQNKLRIQKLQQRLGELV